MRPTTPYRTLLAPVLLAGVVSLLLAFPGNASAQSTPKVAVMPVEDTSGKFDEETVRKATEYLRGGIAAAEGFIVVGEGRQNEKLDELIDEKKKESYEECYDENCQIEVGKALAADTILRTKISHFGTCVLNVELIDLAREASIDGAQRKFSCDMEGLTGAVDRVMADLTGKGESEGEQTDDAPNQTADEDPDDNQTQDDAEDAGSEPEDLEAARERGLTCYHRQRWNCARQNLEPACEEDHPVACARLGLMFQRGDGVDLDYDRARELYEKACETSDDNVGCKNLGRLYENGNGVERDLGRARRLYEQACDEGPAGCRQLGNMYERAKGVDRDYDRARRLYRRACEGEDAIACKYLADMYSLGNGVDADPSRAHALYRKACETGKIRTGCNHAGFRYEKGNGVDQDYRKAREYYEKSCEADNAEGCFNLGHLYEHGHEIPKDLDRAHELYEKACIEGLDKACEIEYPLDDSNGRTP